MGWVGLAILVAGGETFLGALRWRIFLKVLGLQVPFWQSIRLFYLGLFFNAFFVGAVGGDAVKVLALIGQGHPRAPAFLSVVLDRMSGLGAIVLTSCTFILWHYDWLTSSPLVAGLIHFVFVYLGAVLLLLALSLVAAWTGIGDRAPRWVPFRKQLTQMCELYFLFAAKWRQTLLAAGVSCFMMLGYFLVFYCAMRAYGVVPQVTQVFAFMPAVDVISALPISLGGIGVREKLFVVLLGELFGVPGSTAVWVSITGFLTTLFWGMLGLLLLPFYRGSVARGREIEAVEALEEAQTSEVDKRVSE
jgi:uncharacterized protein (TIRG00374 family)